MPDAFGSYNRMSSATGKEFFLVRQTVCGKQFPVCARCTDIFVGYLIGVCILALHRISLCLCLLFMLVMFYDWYIQVLRIKESTNIRKFLSGLLYGIGWVNFVAEITIAFLGKILNCL